MGAGPQAVVALIRDDYERLFADWFHKAIYRWNRPTLQ
jgi:hypothetical protein